MSIDWIPVKSARKIRAKERGNRGIIPPNKSLNGIIEYESQLEHDFLLLLDHDPNCIDLQTQPCNITYISKSDLERKITPDIWAIFNDGRQCLFEMKTEYQFQKMIKKEDWKNKAKAIKDYCKNMGRIYQIVFSLSFFEKKT